MNGYSLPLHQRFNGSSINLAWVAGDHSQEKPVAVGSAHDDPFGVVVNARRLPMSNVTALRFTKYTRTQGAFNWYIHVYPLFSCLLFNFVNAGKRWPTT